MQSKVHSVASIAQQAKEQSLKSTIDTKTDLENLKARRQEFQQKIRDEDYLPVKQSK